jgi:hypothetical protein
VYRDYTPPVDAAQVVRELLDSVPEKYLHGLDCVILTNESALPSRDRRGKVKSRKRKYDKARILGRYHPRWGGQAPYIELRVDKIVTYLRGMPLWIPFLRSVGFGLVLFHELGHHIHHTIRPEYTEKEDVADNWAGKLTVNLIRKKYWYLVPFITPCVKVYRMVRRKS